MRYFVLFLTWFTIGAYAQKIHYDVRFGIFGTVGTLDNTVSIGNGKYKIQTHVKTAPLIRKVFGDYSAVYTSKGIFRNGKFVSRFFSSLSYEKGKKRLITYTRDIKGGIVHKDEKIWKNGKLISHHRSKRPFRGDDDLLTLYFNAGHFYQNRKRSRFVVEAMGLEKQKGKVRMQKLKSDRLEKAYRAKGEVLGYLMADIVSKNIKTKKNNIVLAIGKDGRVQQAVIKDVLLYGDVRVIRKR